MIRLVTPTYVTGQHDLCSDNGVFGDVTLSSDVIRGYSNKNSAVGKTSIGQTHICPFLKSMCSHAEADL